MNLHVFIITFAAWITFSLAQDSGVESNFDLHGLCNKENYDRRKVIKDSDGKETVFICSKNNDGVYSWKKVVVETENDDTDGVMEDVMMKRKAATEFFQRDRRNLHHECYVECCNFEEVLEVKHDINEAKKYYETYREDGCKGGGGW